MLGGSESGHYPDSDPLCHCCWFRDEADELSNGEAAIDQRSIALLLQSNLGLSAHEETALLTRARRQLAAA